jgi:AcrR family transcriptional regulator
VVRFFVGELESSFQIKMTCSGKRVVGPQHHLLVAGAASEVDALLYQPTSETMTAAVIGHQQDPQLRCGAVLTDTEHTSDSSPIELGDPGLLPTRIVLGSIVGDDLGNQGLEFKVPAKLAGVLLTVGHHDPAQIARLSEDPYQNLRLMPGNRHRDSPLPRLTETIVSVETSEVHDDNQPSEQAPSQRRDQLLDASYRWVLRHGLADMSLRPLAEAVESSPRVLLFLFGSKDGLIRALLGRARRDELILLNELRTASDAADLADAVVRVWQWLAAPEHRGLLRLWCEGYARSLIDPDGPWAGFASQTVTDWLDLLAHFQPAESRSSEGALARRTHVLAVLRGAMLDLLATDDITRTSAAISDLERTLRASG